MYKTKNRIENNRKSFKVAHIVPVSCLEQTVDNQYHMCLAHLVDEDDKYCNFYATMARHGKFVLMDNGAAEGVQPNTDALFDAYKKIDPTEIVLPDTLYNSGSTIEKSKQFLKELEARECWYNTMGVPQGHTLSEWEACLIVMLQDERIDTIGVSKFLNIATQDKLARYQACQLIQKYIKRFGREDIEVHLLGCDEGPVIVRLIQEEFPFVRGCDSAFAYLQAQQQKMLTIEDITRPLGTIDFINGRYYDMTPYIDNFNKCAGVNDNKEDRSWM